MSHIFDALQRSESERSGLEPSSFALATELLQAAEGQIRSADNVDSAIPEPPVPLEPEPVVIPVPVASPGHLNPIDQFRSLPVVIPAENRLVSIEREESLGAEKFRFLAVRLRALQQTRPLKRILITSTIPLEGKSTVAANLACTLARRRQQKTLLVDGDLRRPTVARQFGMGNVPGMCEWLRGASPTMNIYRLDSLNLWVFPAGNTPDNPLELMQTGKLSPMMEQLTAWFDWIVIDSPPVLPLADTSIWARLADGVLLVTRQGVTEKKQLQRGLEALEQSKSKILGALVNSSSDAAHSDYYQRYAPPASPPGSRGSHR